MGLSSAAPRIEKVQKKIKKYLLRFILISLEGDVF
jgi:hypothetical protein